MGIIKNGNNVVALYKGATPLIKRYKGSNLIWQLVQDNILEFEFTGSSLKYKVNNVTYTAATSPYKTTVDDMIYCNDMFSGTSLTNIIQFPNTSNVTNMTSMFGYCNGLTSLDLSGWDTSNVTNMSDMFYNCYNLTSLDLSSFDTSNVTSIGSMFSSCYNLTSLDLSSFDTSNVTNMGYMFYNCYNLTSLDLSSFDTSNVTSIGSMFYNCYNLTSLDLSSFDTSNVTNMGYMFYKCSGLTSLDLSSFDTSNVTATTNAFQGCKSLEEIEWEEFGKGYYFTSISFADCVKLGTNIGREMFRQTFIDRSYDRASAGLPTCTITLSSNTKIVLSQSEIAQMTKKGFTIA